MIGFDPASLDSGAYTGPIAIDYYGRPHPKHAGGTVRLRARTASTRLITAAVLQSFDAHVDSRLLVRRMVVAAANTHQESEQLDLFTDYAALEREEKVQRVILELRRKYGGNALLRGMNFLQGGTARERNTQIGGHRA